MGLHASRTNVLVTLNPLTCLFAVSIPRSAQAQIELRGAVKFVLGPPQPPDNTRPYPTVIGVLDKANPGDVLMIRGGTYDENLIIQDNVTLRASRGDAVIGTDDL